MHRFERGFVNLLENFLKFVSTISDIIRRYDTLDNRAPKEFTKTINLHVFITNYKLYHLLVLSRSLLVHLCLFLF